MGRAFLSLLAEVTALSAFLIFIIVVYVAVN